MIDVNPCGWIKEPCTILTSCHFPFTHLSPYERRHSTHKIQSKDVFWTVRQVDRIRSYFLYLFSFKLSFYASCLTPKCNPVRQLTQSPDRNSVLINDNGSCNSGFYLYLECIRLNLIQIYLCAVMPSQLDNLIMDLPGTYFPSPSRLFAVKFKYSIRK